MENPKNSSIYHGLLRYFYMEKMSGLEGTNLKASMQVRPMRSDCVLKNEYNENENTAQNESQTIGIVSRIKSNEPNYSRDPKMTPIKVFRRVKQIKM